MAFFRFIAAIPSRSWIVMAVARLFVLSGDPYFTAQTHGLDELVRSSLPPAQVMQLSQRIFAVIIPFLIPLSFRTDNSALGLCSGMTCSTPSLGETVILLPELDAYTMKRFAPCI